MHDASVSFLPIIVERSKVGKHSVYLIDPPPLKQSSIVSALLLVQKPSQLRVVHREEVLQVPRNKLYANQCYFTYVRLSMETQR